MNKARLEAFSDGVFAIAATLLVLGLVLPPLSRPNEAGIFHALLALWPNVVAYVLSFFVIGIMWMNHHALFRSLDRVDRPTFLFNLLLMAITAFIPFATSVLGSYPTTRTATFFYGFVLTVASTAYNLMLMHVVKARLFSQKISPSRVAQTVVNYRIGLFIYAVAMLVSLLAPLVSYLAYILIAAFYLIPRGVDETLE